MADILVRYFNNLFTSSRSSVVEIEEVVLNIGQVVDDSMNEYLGAWYMEDDIY